MLYLCLEKLQKSQSKGFTLVKGLEPLSFLIFCK